MRISDWSSDVCSSDLHKRCGTVTGGHDRSAAVTTGPDRSAAVRNGRRRPQTVRADRPWSAVAGDGLGLVDGQDMVDLHAVAGQRAMRVFDIGEIEAEAGRRAAVEIGDRKSTRLNSSH